MSYIGDPYEYDVFFSYPHAVEALRGRTTLREWSLKVIDTIAEIVTLSLADEPDGENFHFYLDRDHAASADPLTDKLEEAVQKSAVFVIFMSPFYKRWSLKELDWFLAKAKADGRGFRQCVLLEVQRTSERAWPEQLVDKAGEQLFHKRLTDEVGLPLDFERFKATQTLPNTGNLLTNIAIEIRNKLIEVRRLRTAQRSMAASKVNAWNQVGQAPPDDRLIYLDAELEDHQTWRDRRDTLSAARTVVLPDSPLEAPMGERSEGVLNIYKDCDALILHRVREDDAIQPRIRRAFQDRRLLYQKERKAMPWAVLDELPDAPLPSAATFRVPRVSTRESDWADRLFQALGGAPASQAAQ